MGILGGNNPLYIIIQAFLLRLSNLEGGLIGRIQKGNIVINFIFCISLYF